VESVIVIYGGKDITSYVSSMSWGGSRTEVARKLELKIVNAPLDKNITPLTLELANPVYLYEDDGKTELFRGIITDREASSATGTVAYTAYDLLFYTLKSKATYNFSGKTAEAITQMVCSDFEIPVGNLASTGLNQKLIVQNVGLYEIIMQAYTQAYEKSGKMYRVTASKGKLNVEEMGKVVCEIELTEDSNITASSYKETINNMVNRVRIYDGEGNQVGLVQNDADLKYGVFQQIYTKEEGKDPTTTAKSMFKGVEKTFNLQGINYNGAVTGSGAIIRDTSTGLNGLVWIDADTHSWSNGVATMNLTVTLKQIMDTKAVTTTAEKASEKSSSSSTPTVTPSTNTTVTNNAYSGSKSNPPYAIINKVEREVKTGFTTYNEAYVYFMTNKGTANEWRIVDKDRKQVL
jgi:hypothetical protein